jgi:hypothetical protein
MTRTRIAAALVVLALLIMSGLVARQGLLTSRIVQAAEQLPPAGQPAACAYLLQDFRDLRSSYSDGPAALAARSADGVQAFHIVSAQEGCWQ